MTLPHIASGRVALPVEVGPYIDPRVSDDIPTNEYGIVVLENPQPCAGEECRLRGSDEECYIDLDHLHHSGAYYEQDSPLAAEFQELDVLTRWVFRCVHESKHEAYPHNVPVPRRRIMKKVIPEARLLKEIEVNYRERTSMEAVLRRPDLSRHWQMETRKSLNRKYNDRKKLIKSVENIEFLPEEIVTGALLLAVPGHAESRLISNPNFMLPGTIRKEEVPQAWQAAAGMLERCEERSRVWAELNQLDRHYLEAVAGDA